MTFSKPSYWKCKYDRCNNMISDIDYKYGAVKQYCSRNCRQLACRDRNPERWRARMKIIRSTFWNKHKHEINALRRKKTYLHSLQVQNMMNGVITSQSTQRNPSLSNLQ